MPQQNVSNIAYGGRNGNAACHSYSLAKITGYTDLQKLEVIDEIVANCEGILLDVRGAYWLIKR